MEHQSRNTQRQSSMRDRGRPSSRNTYGGDRQRGSSRASQGQRNMDDQRKHSPGWSSGRSSRSDHERSSSRKHDSQSDGTMSPRNKNMNITMRPVETHGKPPPTLKRDTFLADPKKIAQRNRTESFPKPPPKRDSVQKPPTSLENETNGLNTMPNSLSDTTKPRRLSISPSDGDAPSNTVEYPVGTGSLFTPALDDQRRYMKGAYSQLTMEERIRALSLLKRHGLFPQALKIQKAPRPFGLQKGLAPTQQVIDEAAIFEVVKAAVDDVPLTQIYRKKPTIEVPVGAVGAVGTSGIKPPVPTPEDSDTERDFKKYVPPGTVEPKGVVPICDEKRPCVKAEPCKVKPPTKDLSKVLSPSQMEAHHYLSKKKIFEFFQFMICHLLAEQPADPVAFLGNLLDRCMMYRSGFCDPPLLFTEKHVTSMYRALDPGELGNINMKQYETGMKTIGVTNYTTDPVTDENGNISKEFFINEAVRCLTDELMEMLKVGEVEPWKYLDKWWIPTAKVVGEGEDRTTKASLQNLPPPPPPSSSRMTAPGGPRHSSGVGSVGNAGLGPWVAPSGGKPGTVAEPAPDQKSHARASTIGNPSAAESLRRDNERYHSHMHDGPDRD